MTSTHMPRTSLPGSPYPSPDQHTSAFQTLLIPDQRIQLSIMTLPNHKFSDPDFAGDLLVGLLIGPDDRIQVVAMLGVFASLPRLLSSTCVSANLGATFCACKSSRSFPISSSAVRGLEEWMRECSSPGSLCQCRLDGVLGWSSLCGNGARVYQKWMRGTSRQSLRTA